MTGRTIGVAVAVALAGCGGETSTGALTVQLEAEETISGGLAAGTADEDVVDGWSVTFEQYVIAIGEIELEGGGDEPFHADTVLVVDLAEVPASGLELARIDAIPAGLWPQIFFATPLATADAARHASVPQADFDRMVAEGCTYLIRGTLESPDGERCIGGDATMCTAVASIAFDLCVPAETHFGPCETDTGIEGVTIAGNNTTAVNLTIHGDHLFFNGFPAGAEGTVARRAQWLADADVDADGTVTRADLESITGASALGRLLPADAGDGLPGFDLAASPIPLASAWDYVRAQLKTQGHFQGEGECGIDGTAHAH